MHIIEKVQKIEEFVDNYIDHDKVLNCIEEALSKNLNTILHNKNYKTNIECIINIEDFDYKADVETLYSNDLSQGPLGDYIRIYIPRREDIDFNFRIWVYGKQRIFFPDVLDTITSIDELEEMIFNLVLVHGDDINVSKLLFTYVLYKKYKKVVPDKHEISILIKSATCIYEQLGI